MKRFDNKCVAILGGNAGIGLAAARMFAAEGARLAITGRNAETLRAVAEELSALGKQSPEEQEKSLPELMSRVESRAVEQIESRTAASGGSSDDAGSYQYQVGVTPSHSFSLLFTPSHFFPLLFTPFALLSNFPI